MNILKYFLIGTFLTILFPPYFFLPIGFIIFPLICFSFENLKLRSSAFKVFIYSFFLGIGFFSTVLIWIINPFFVFDETKNLFFLSFLLILIFSIILGLVFTFFIYFFRNISSVILIPIIFITTEFVISRIGYGFPWITFASIVSNSEIFLFLIKYTGTLLTSFIVIVLFCIPYIFLAKIEIRKEKYFLYFLIPFIFILVLIFHYSEYSNKISNYSKSFDITTFQLNTEIDRNKNPNITFNKIKNLIKNSNAEILIFAENNFPYIIHNEKLDILSDLLKIDQILIIGSTSKTKNGYFNSLYSIEKNNIQKFDKKILVPFGEFLPMRNYLKFLNYISGDVDYSVGKKERFIDIDNKFNFIPIICYEIIFYWKLINSLNYKSDLIINITNDVWFGKYIGPYQHLYLVKLRAAEFNKPIIRVSNNGISSSISKEGKIIKYTNLNKTETMKIKLEINKSKSFTEYHNYFNILIMLLNIFFLFFSYSRNYENK